MQFVGRNKGNNTQHTLYTFFFPREVLILCDKLTRDRLRKNCYVMVMLPKLIQVIRSKNTKESLIT